MYVARFSYDVLPANRERAVDLIRKEVQAASEKGIKARLLVPLTRGPGGASLQFEMEVTGLDQLEQFRQAGVESAQETSEWMSAFSEILLSPPGVEILRIG